MIYTLTLTSEESDLLGVALRQMPLGQILPLYEKVRQQILAQDQAAQSATAEQRTVSGAIPIG